MSVRNGSSPVQVCLPPMDNDTRAKIDDIIEEFCPRVADPNLKEFGLFATNEAENPQAKEAFCLFSWYKMCLEIIKLSKRKGLNAEAQVEFAKR